MGTWNYRLCKETVREHDGTPVFYYSLREAYYNDNEEVWAVTENAVGIGFDQYSFDTFDPVEETASSLARMQQALERPILDLDTIVFAEQTYTDDEDEVAEVIDFEGDLGVDNGD